MAASDARDASSSPATPAPKAELDASKLVYNLTSPQGPTTVPNSGCTDHMLICNWDEATGWENPVIQPFGPLSLLPSANVLQYATGCFEGVKAYRGYDGQLRLFRLRLNCERMLKSSVRVGLPQFDPGALEQLIHSFVALEAERWLPKDRVGQTLYLRPTHIGTTPGLGLQQPRQASLYLIATLAPGFSTNGGMTLVTSPAGTIRAWPGGFGNAKLSANYGPTLSAHADAIAQGFDQVLWLFGDEQYATEAGASNFFVIWRTRQGGLELVTAGLESKTILEGITRRSIIELAHARRDEPQSWSVDGTTLEPLTVVERDFSINDIREAVSEGRLVEAFASGTAYFIAPVRHIRHRDEDIVIPREKGDSGHYAALFKGWLSDIVYGRYAFSDWTKVVKETQ
ncbi:Branched-chain-amino-acid aminotransferase [Fusarium falciforme]|uniref:Branched-chain-amino-acid aminotransferase n=1 Tax=Fusarium falciforme TaxID=195108 RepID=UPI0023004A4B|nr:Branched-chain-amino-acid aminotransferase [Fusarium falciforme]WAO84558.1 Branched-chain-amino-acid aminotransferase [Fusarium falciforme]